MATPTEIIQRLRLANAYQDDERLDSWDVLTLLGYIEGLEKDKGRLDEIERVGRETGYGSGFLLRQSSTGRGIRLHTAAAGVDPDPGDSWDIREAIDRGLARIAQGKARCPMCQWERGLHDPSCSERFKG